MKRFLTARLDQRMTLIAETDRLVMREFKLSDLDALASIMADPRVMEFSTSGPWGRDRTRVFLENCQVDYSVEEWSYRRWALIHKEDNHLIGYCGFARYEEVGGSPEVAIGYRLTPDYWGRGLATEAAVATRDYGLGHLEMTRLISTIEPENSASIRVAEKIGMRCEKQVQKWNLQLLVYAISSSS